MNMYRMESPSSNYCTLDGVLLSLLQVLCLSNVWLNLSYKEPNEPNVVVSRELMGIKNFRPVRVGRVENLSFHFYPG